MFLRHLILNFVLISTSFDLSFGWIALPNVFKGGIAKQHYFQKTFTKLTAITESPLKVNQIVQLDNSYEKESEVKLPGTSAPCIVLIAGFEEFNIALYREAAREAMKLVPSVSIYVFTDVDIQETPSSVEDALSKADVFFGSLLFDFEKVSWIKKRITGIKTRFCFESALELMSDTKVGNFQMVGGKGAGPPAPVKAILKQFGSGKEEDRLAGYLNLLKFGSSLLKWVPGDGAKDLRLWLSTYSYWNQGAKDNIIAMFLLLIKELQLAPPNSIPSPSPLKETPANGFIHPDLPSYLSSPSQYEKWFLQTRPWVTESTPRVAVLLYRKHVISELSYIPELIRQLEAEGLFPIPIFINGVEAHTIVRDSLTTAFEQAQRRRGVVALPSLSTDNIRVDAVVNTIGFPLVGGPAGSMEGGRQADVAREILSAKNVPYVVAAPLLIQDIESWKRDGVQGLQSVILFSLPELDGAVEPTVLGGLRGKEIALLPERVTRLCGRLKAWVSLKKKSAYDRRVGILVYGFPPNVGAVATAALLDVGESLRSLLLRMKENGYDLGECEPEGWRGEDIVEALRDLCAEGVGEGGIDRARRILLGTGRGRVTSLQLLPGVDIEGQEVTREQFWEWVGPEMGGKIERQWGDLESYRNPGLGSTSAGKFAVIGLRVGKVFLGVQPLLGLEGDPMRLLFQRDLTPHPQYAAFYLWLQRQRKIDVLVHFGMHGTVEWLPGSPLGSTEASWPDKLLGDAPNVYLYACNNPSESLLAKRRGYATVLSHNVPPYSRAGLYQQLKTIREALLDYSRGGGNGGDESSIAVIAATAEKAGLYEDLPFNSTFTALSSSSNGTSAESDVLTLERVTEILDSSDLQYKSAFLKEFSNYASRLGEYLFELENRLFSSGLHVLGGGSNAEAIRGYLEALCGSDGVESGLAPEVLDTIAEAAARGESRVDILLRAQEVQSSVRSHRVSTERQFTWGYEEMVERTLARRSGVDYSNLLTREDKFALSLLLEAGPIDFLNLLWLRVQRDWGVPGAEDQIRQLIEISNRRKKSVENGGSKLSVAVELAELLHRNGEEEMLAMLRALGGEFTPAASGGDIIRDGLSVLPTGRNIHALDPYRLPSETAMRRGAQAAEAIIKTHQAANNGTYPETVAVTLWGLDTIKTKGESIGILLTLVGAVPVREATGRIVAFDPISLELLQRPRIDVIGSLSGIFRDSFGNVLDLLDDLFLRLSELDEPENMNYIKKHTSELRAKGVDRPSSRLFYNPPGDFGSMVVERVGTGEWESGKQLGDTWESRNAWSYGKGNEKGAARPVLLKALLNSTDRIVQQIDSVEYGLTDIQEYYANTGALKKAAENNREGRKVAFSVVEAFDKNVRPRELEETLRLEYRSKLLNPRWAQAMAAQGAGGAYEISGRMTAMLGWAGTTGFSEKWVYDGAAETYVLDEAMAETLRSANPEAFRNILRRMLEANGRGYWKPEKKTLAHLQGLYDDVEDVIEGV